MEGRVVIFNISIEESSVLIYEEELLPCICLFCVSKLFLNFLQMFTNHIFIMYALEPYCLCLNPSSSPNKLVLLVGKLFKLSFYKILRTVPGI